jgi:hypothetical protein
MFMKGKFRRRAGPAPPILALAALVVALLVAATTPLALAKYVANGTGSATGTVAKWDVKFFQSPSPPYATSYLNGNHYGGPGAYNFCVYTGGTEVAANIKLQVRYTTSTAVPTASDSSITFPTNLVNDAAHGVKSITNNYDFADPTPSNPLHGSPGSGLVEEVSDVEFDYAPSSWVWFTLETKAYTPLPSVTDVSGYMRSYKVFVDATQID